jgi:integrase
MSEPPVPSPWRDRLWVLAIVAVILAAGYAVPVMLWKVLAIGEWAARGQVGDALGPAAGAFSACALIFALLEVRPDRGPKTAKQYLYPSEFQRFAACKDVPLAWRRSVAIAIYTFPRAGELRVLRWEDVDLEHRMVHIHRARDRNKGEEKPTKTAIARRFSIEPALLPLLRTMHEESDGRGLVSELSSARDMARGFCRWLAKAGVDRAELHTSSRTRKAMTFHDLRATRLTWLAVRGDDPLKIMGRAGHVDFATTQGYIRTAEAVRVGFAALPASLLKAPETGSGDASDASEGSATGSP